MSESTTEPTTPAVEEWKPEPRTWVWKDLFTAPMLAFKPKCMLVSALTLIAVAQFANVWIKLLDAVGQVYVITPILIVLGLIIGTAIFSLGATLVSVFMKADLLDDEFLSLKEAIGQWSKRIVPAIMVPSFLIGTVFGFVVLLFLALFAGSIPIVGPVLLTILLPLGFLLGLLTVLVAIAVGLSTFLFPSIISVRKHGWFDNVIDTFEAVGTKPHVVVLNIALTGLIITVCVSIAFAGMGLLESVASAREIPWTGAEETLVRASSITDMSVSTVFTGISGQTYQAESGFINWFTGLFSSFWMIPITVFIIGYGLNVFLAGGMLTYLFVREDDYWDDEDLEDLDKLAKELEEEAKAEAAKAESETQAAAPAETEPKAGEEATATADEPKAEEEAPAIADEPKVEEEAPTPKEEVQAEEESSSEDETQTEKSEESEEDKKDDGK